MDYGDESDDDPMSMEMLGYIRDRSQYHPDFNRRHARYKIRDHIKQRKMEWKGALQATRNIGKGLHKVFKNFVKYISQDLPPLGESGSEVSHLIPELIDFAEVTKLSDDINKPWLKAN